MRGIINMKGVDESGDFEVVPEGVYDVIIKEISDRISAKNDPMANIMLEIQHGDFQGSKLWDNIVFPKDDSPSIKIKGRTRHFLHAIGEPYEDKENLEYNTDNWLFKSVRVEVCHEKYNGKIKSKIANYIVEDSNEDIPF